MSDKAEREKRKAFLLSQIQQQRLDLSASRRDWIDATRRFDRGWNTFLSLRLGSGWQQCDGNLDDPSSEYADPLGPTRLCARAPGAR